MAVATENLSVLHQKLETALADFQAGRLGEAARAYRAIVEEIPSQPDALHMLGAIAQRMGKTELALALFDEALQAVPTFAQAWSNHALILRILRRTEEALQSGRRAIACDPKLANGWDITGLILRERREYASACEHHARAVALHPDNPLYQNNYAVALIACGRVEDAYMAASRAVANDPAFAIARLTLGNILNEAGYPEQAIDCYRKAYALDPAFTEAIATEGRMLVLIGDLEPGWAKMEVRDYGKERFAALPRWQGEKVRHLLLYAEQGVGDVVHFLRYLPLIRDRAETVSLQVPASLRKLIGVHLPDTILITPDDPLPPADRHGLLMSLPHFCKTTLANIPAPIPYMHAQEPWREPWRARLAALPKPHIGIVWMGNPLYSDDHKRSLSTEQVKPLLSAAGLHLVSLQKGSTTATAANTGTFDADPWLDDFAATAGLIAELDLIITVDTGVAHLAGAMGRPVWTLLPFAPDWRWMLGREDSPWYPTMRLFRQKTPYDWVPVVARLTAELRGFLAGDHSVLPPPVWQGHVLRQNPGAIELPKSY